MYYSPNGIVALAVLKKKTVLGNVFKSLDDIKRPAEYGCVVALEQQDFHDARAGN
jgi:hypothetical protein